MHLFLGHVQQTDRVAVTVEVCPYCVQSFVELTLDIRELLEHFVSGPQKQLYTKHHNNLTSQHLNICISMIHKFVALTIYRFACKLVVQNISESVEKKTFLVIDFNVYKKTFFF